MSYPTCSLIATTYNWPESLELLLLSIVNQTILPNEVIIADDGSREDTKELIEIFQKVFPIPLIHVWHEDKGFRLATIRNKAISKAKYHYILQIDGDIIPNRSFVKDHLTFAKKEQYLYGSRVNIQEKLLQKLFFEKIIDFNLFSKGIKKRGRTIRFPFLMNFVKNVDKRSRKLRGCNMSFWKEDFIKINGYNESIIGWGMEDSEMIQRLHNIGIKGKRLKFAGIAYHVYHKEQSKSHIEINNEIERLTTEKKLTFIEKGINQYL
jgi:glycosyltransferase involved in cell wall biosynthesis